MLRILWSPRLLLSDPGRTLQKSQSLQPKARALQLRSQRRQSNSYVSWTHLRGKRLVHAVVQYYIGARIYSLYSSLFGNLPSELLFFILFNWNGMLFWRLFARRFAIRIMLGPTLLGAAYVGYHMANYGLGILGFHEPWKSLEKERENACCIYAFELQLSWRQRSTNNTIPGNDICTIWGLDISLAKHLMPGAGPGLRSFVEEIGAGVPTLGVPGMMIDHGKIWKNHRAEMILTWIKFKSSIYDWFCVWTTHL